MHPIKQDWFQGCQAWARAVGSSDRSQHVYPSVVPPITRGNLWGLAQVTAVDCSPEAIAEARSGATSIFDVNKYCPIWHAK
jgi:hypothetical protein